MTLSCEIEVGWIRGDIPRPLHPSWPDIEIQIQVYHWYYGEYLSEQHIDELRDYLAIVADKLPDYFLKNCYKEGNCRNQF